MGKRIVLPKERKKPDSEVFMSFLKVGITVVALGLVGVLFFSFFSVIFINLMTGVPLDLMSNNSEDFTQEVVSEDQDSSGTTTVEFDDEGNPIVVFFNDTEEPQEGMNDTDKMNMTSEEVVDVEFVLDRRPVAAIPLFIGLTSEAPFGLKSEWWCGLSNCAGTYPSNWQSLSNHHGIDANPQAGVDWLIGELDHAYNQGFRRINLILPAGRSYLVDDIMGSTHWEPLSQERRDILSDEIPIWLNSHSDASLGIYSGFDIDNDPENLEFNDRDIPNVDSQQSINEHYNLFRPWRDIGFKEVFWDYASTLERREISVTLFEDYLDNHGLRSGGEAQYREFIGGTIYTGKLDPNYINRIPAMALATYFYKWDPGFADHPDSLVDDSALDAGPWTVDPESTELFFAYRSTAEFDYDDAVDAVQRGFIPWTYSRGLYDETMDIWNIHGLNKG